MRAGHRQTPPRLVHQHRRQQHQIVLLQNPPKQLPRAVNLAPAVLRLQISTERRQQSVRTQAAAITLLLPATQIAARHIPINV